ncbi:MAG: phytanoyl-CoA dioxygenase family protein [Pseudomonadota bacterium]
MDMPPNSLSSAQFAAYERDGFLLLRNAVTDEEIRRLESGLSRAIPVDRSLDPTAPVYPEAGRYTYATQNPADPDLAFIIEHPAVVGPVTQLLGDEPRLSAYVIYDRSPGGQGIPSHQDYKRWRPVGSSMNWLFAIVPFTDFDEELGRLEVAPGSHHLHRVTAGNTPCLEVAPAIRPDESAFIDPELRRGDLLLMNMHLWHRAPENTSNRNRVGLFNKYAGVSAPPATGWYRYGPAVQRALTAHNQALIPTTGESAVTMTRAVLVRHRHGQPEVLCLESELDGRWMLPGGEAAEERAIADWDHGNVIGSLQQHLRLQIGGETPWMSYIGDFDEPEGVSRVYGYTVHQGRIAGETVGRWCPVAELEGSAFAFGWEPSAVARWLDPSVMRGKGLAQTQARVDQFAY